MKKYQEDILEYVDDFRKKLNINEHEIVGDLSKRLDNSFFILRFPNKMEVSGASFVKEDRDKKYKCIYINNIEPIGRQNFTLAHELYHIYYEDSNTGLCMEKDRESNDVEKKAEMFASNLLIPRILLLVDLKKLGMTNEREIKEEHIIYLQEKYNVTFQAILYSIDSIKNYKQYNEFTNIVPTIPTRLKKFYNKNYWDELEKIIKSYNPRIKLNSSYPEFVIPEDFKQNLIKNYKRNLIDYAEIKDIFYFFEIESELKKL